jgi:hypothetical protein
MERKVKKMDNLWTAIGYILFTLILFKFVMFIFATKRTRYDDWAAEQRRLQLLETVRSIRREAGDYDRPRTAPRAKKLRRGTAARRTR